MRDRSMANFHRRMPAPIPGSGSRNGHSPADIPDCKHRDKPFTNCSDSPFCLLYLDIYVSLPVVIFL